MQSEKEAEISRKKPGNKSPKNLAENENYRQSKTAGLRVLKLALKKERKQHGLSAEMEPRKRLQKFAEKLEIRTQLLGPNSANLSRPEPGISG